MIRAKRLALLLLLSISFSAHATAGDAKEVEKIKSNLKQNFPQLEIESVASSEVPGFYQVNSGPIVIYISKDGRFVFSGDILDLDKGQSNLAEVARKKARIKTLNGIGKENMVIFAPKDPKHTLTVFTDVDCGYCRKLQNDIPELNAKGIEVRYLAFPRSGPNSPTFEKMVKVWCSKDKAKALADAKQDKEVKTEPCENNAVLQELQLGMQLGVSGTPTLVFEDGTVFPGYLPPDKIVEVLQQLAQEKN